MRAKALSAGTFILNIPESFVVTPALRPRITTETLLSGCSFSSSTLPDTVAVFFCAKENTDASRNRMRKQVLDEFMKDKTKSFCNNGNKMDLFFKIEQIKTDGCFCSVYFTGLNTVAAHDLIF